MEITPLAPPSVQLVPAKEYNGAPIGTSYDVRVYVGEWKNLISLFCLLPLAIRPDEHTLKERVEDIKRGNKTKWEIAKRLHISELQELLSADQVQSLLEDERLIEWP